MPPLTQTARRMHAAREIKITLAEAQAELAAGVSLDRQAQLEALITALQERLGKRRDVVLAARTRSLQMGVLRRFNRITWIGKRPIVWSFPIGYSPNEMGDRCEVCRAVNWMSRPIPGQDALAWTCASCPAVPRGIPT